MGGFTSISYQTRVWLAKHLYLGTRYKYYLVGGDIICYDAIVTTCHRAGRKVKKGEEKLFYDVSRVGNLGVAMWSVGIQC